MADAFDYVNLNERPIGRALRLAGRLSRRIGDIEAQTVPFADAWRRSNLDNLRSSAGPLWVVLGDSISQGIGAPAYDRGWVGQLAAELPGHRLVNLSFRGATIAEALARQVPVMSRLAPELVTVVIGSNDLRGRSKWAVANSYRQLLSQLPPGSIVSTLPNGDVAARLVNTAIDQAVAAPVREVYAAEMRGYGLFTWRGHLASDLFHPNERGHARIAAAFAEALSRRRAARGSGAS